ncbi:hypothetical protein MAR_016935 [Mya arenaria]|uniref:Uncharacterized protein n=1 Tax=Mya arenaria TaxID=6604 RepID=A0ABY7EDF6_MYAAR|nr:hypothetical protein MAR_016935 [Mya arenaria]
MDAYQQETHYWPLRCYPRPEYFHTRLKDIFPRFKRLIGAFPKRFHGVTYRQTLDRLQSLVTMFDCDIKFTLHGKEVPPYKEFLYHNPGADEINTEGCKADHKLQLTKAATLENSSLSGHEVKIFFADMKDFNEIVHELKQVPVQKDMSIFLAFDSDLTEIEKEIERCLERTITGEFNLTTRVRSIPPQLKKELLRIKHVLMIGNVYDKIAVFVDVESTHGEKATDVETSEARVDDRLNENRKEIDNQSSRESKDRSGFYRKSSTQHYMP